MSDLGPTCSTCGEPRGPRIPADLDGKGCLGNIWHTETPEAAGANLGEVSREVEGEKFDYEDLKAWKNQLGIFDGGI